MQRSDERMAKVDSGVELAYDTFGSREDPAVLLIMGLSGPMIWWSAEFCSQLADRGFFVIRFDNRDIGKSTKMSEHRVRRSDTIRAFIRGSRARPAYTLSDLAADAVGLLDHLEIEHANITGVSMGGMIAQTIAIEHADRVLSLVSIMSTTGKRSVGWQDPRIFPLLLRSKAVDKQSYVTQSMTVQRLIGSPGYPTPGDDERAMAEATYDRGLSPAGVLRQMHAILASPDRTPRLRRLDLPTLVIHGLSDKMVNVSGGRATAAAVPRAELVLVPGMGHDLPPVLWPIVIDGIERTAGRARVGSG